MKIKRYMKPYTCGELQENLKRDKLKLADLESRIEYWKGRIRKRQFTHRKKAS